MQTTDLTNDWRTILDALTSGPRAWVTPGGLATRLGREAEALTDELASMDVAGWLDIWERPEGVAVTLSAWGAERLGVRLAECGGGLSYRWVEVGHPERAAFRARGVAAGAPLEDLDLVFDPAPPPDADLDALDLPSDDGDDPVDPATLPRPNRLVGDRLTPWPGPGADRPRGEASGCPACRGRELGPRDYCLRCDRWGLDGRLRPVRRGGASSKARARNPRPEGTRAGPPPEAQRLRARRKARRRSRFHPDAGGDRHRTRRQNPA
jgi:hypothetical protein